MDWFAVLVYLYCGANAGLFAVVLVMLYLA